MVPYVTRVPVLIFGMPYILGNTHDKFVHKWNNWHVLAKSNKQEVISDPQCVIGHAISGHIWTNMIVRC